MVFFLTLLLYNFYYRLLKDLYDEIDRIMEEEMAKEKDSKVQNNTKNITTNNQNLRGGQGDIINIEKANKFKKLAKG